MSLFCRMKLSKIIHSVAGKISWIFFLTFLFRKWKIWWLVSVFLKSNMSQYAAYNCSSSSKNNPWKTNFILPKNDCTRKAWITAINRKEGTLPMNISLCYNILKKIISIEGEDNRHNYFTYQIPRKRNCKRVDCCSNLENENTLAIEMRKCFTEAANENSSSNLCLAAITKILKKCLWRSQIFKVKVYFKDFHLNCKAVMLHNSMHLAIATSNFWTYFGQNLAGLYLFSEVRYRISQKSVLKTLLNILLIVKMKWPNVWILRYFKIKKLWYIVNHL